jgi:hypothetical protein
VKLSFDTIFERTYNRRRAIGQGIVRHSDLDIGPRPVER